MPQTRRRFLELVGATLGGVAGCVTAPAANGTPAATPVSTPTATSTATPESTPTRTSTPAKTPRAAGAITIEGSEWKLVPATFTTEPGRELTVTFENVGSVAHNLTIGEFPIETRAAVEQARAGEFTAKTETIQPNHTDSVTITPETAGTYPYWCDVSGHRQAGMEGRMVVK